MSNVTKIKGIPENETLLQKCKRKAKTAVNWGKTHWKGLAIGAVALGGGAYMLSRRSGSDDSIRTVDATKEGGTEAIREAIDRCFSDTDDSDEPDGTDEVDEY